MKMNTPTLFLIAAFALAAVHAADGQAGKGAPAMGIYHYVETCRACNGNGTVEINPPDRGQHSGAIGSKRQWRRKAVCAVCGGKCKREYLRTEVDPADEHKEFPPCRKCGWSGVEKCRKCSETGYVPCRNAKCSAGWVAAESCGNAGSGRKKPPELSPCPECHGRQKVVCLACGGRGGVPCSGCKGIGYDTKAVERQKRDEERKAERERREQERKAERERREEERKAERERREEERRQERQNDKAKRNRS